MLRFLPLALLPIIMSGCLSMPAKPGSEEVESVPDLVMVRPSHPYDPSIRNISISDDGNTFLGWGEHDGVLLSRSGDYSTIERFYEIDKSQLRFERDVGRPTALIRGAGFFDHNTWYFGALPLGRKDVNIICPDYVTSIDVHIRTIQPPREIAKYSYCWNNNDVLISNKNYFAIISAQLREKFKSEGVLVDWRTGKHYPVNTVDNFRGITKYELTGSSRVLSDYSFLGKDKEVTLVDPFSPQKERLERSIVFSPDERYGIDMGGARCKLRKFPGREIAPLNDKEIVGYCSDKLSLFKDLERYEVAFSPDGKYFVFAFEHNFRVYRVEPFRLELEGKTVGNIVRIKLSENGMLAAGDSKGFVRVWDIMKKQIIGQHRFYDPGGEGSVSSVLSILFHPNGDKLYVLYDYLNVFQLPKSDSK